MALALGLLLAATLGLALLAWIAQGSMLARAARRPRGFPPVSILKPLKGADPALEENLRGFFGLSYPAYELVFAVADDDDPVLPLVRRLVVEHPQVAARLVVSPRRLGLNPKVNNLALAADVAGHDLLLISDSNVRVRPGYVEDMVAHLDGAALVSSLIRGSGEGGLGGRLEALQLNGFVMGGVAAWSGLLGRTAVVGKSMLLRRETLDAIGGFRFLGQFLAEDQVCGEEVARRCGRVVVTGQPVDNRLGRLNVKEFCKRHVRWACVRRRISLPGYVSEVLLNPVGVALLGVVTLRSAPSLLMLTAALLVMSLLGLSAERRLGIRRPAWTYLGLELLRATLVLALWPWPFVSSSVTWRGNRLRIASRTRLVPVVSPPSAFTTTEILAESALESRA
jgi:ceramide glucosyltransferase